MRSKIIIIGNWDLDSYVEDLSFAKAIVSTVGGQQQVLKLVLTIGVNEVQRKLRIGVTGKE